MSCAYPVYEVKCENKRLVLVTDIHHCHGDWYETQSDDRMNLLCSCLKEAHEQKPFDAIVTLGDYSLDFWKYQVGGSWLWNPPVSYTDDFVKKYVPQMPAPFYMIPGNHEQYGHEDWLRITGKPREYVIVYGDYVLVMLDTFAGELDPKVHSDGCYTGINAELLSAVLEDYPEKKIILCAHDIYLERESEEARRLICESRQILCAFTGHTHRENTLLLPDAWRNLPVFYCGDFSYNLGARRQKNWGYRVLEFTARGVSTEYITA